MTTTAAPSPTRYDFALARLAFATGGQTPTAADIRQEAERRAAERAAEGMTPAQVALRRHADDLLAALDRMVPTNVVHYAVEDARRALRELSVMADTIGAVQ